MILIGIFWNISNAENCDCWTFYKKKAKGKKTLKNTRIFDGRTITKDEKYRYPWQIFLIMDSDDENDKFSYDCGGSLISKKHILTAALI